MSAGRPDFSFQDYYSENTLKCAKNMGVKIFPVLIGSTYGQAKLQILAEETEAFSIMQLQRKKSEMLYSAFKKIFVCLVLACLVLLVRNRSVNECFYLFTKSIKEEFEYVNDIEMGNSRPHCRIRIYVKDGCNDYNSIEPVFIKAMIETSKEKNFQYFSKNHIQSASGEMAFLHVYFYRENGEELYRFTSYKVFDVWELESDRSVQFRVSDYLQ